MRHQMKRCPDMMLFNFHSIQRKQKLLITFLQMRNQSWKEKKQYAQDIDKQQKPDSNQVCQILEPLGD